MIVRYTPEAIRDLQELRRYIRVTLRNPKAADQIAKAILDACGQLKHYPKLGPSLDANIGQTTGMRYLVCENHIAFYRIEPNAVSVVRILNARQDYLHILFDLPE